MNIIMIKMMIRIMKVFDDWYSVNCDKNVMKIKNLMIILIIKNIMLIMLMVILIEIILMIVKQSEVKNVEKMKNIIIEVKNVFLIQIKWTI